MINQEETGIMTSIISNLDQLEQAMMIKRIVLKGDFNSRLKRYKMWQERIDTIDQQIESIKKSSSTGQEPKVFYQLLDEALDIQIKRILHVWNQVRKMILPNSRFKTLATEIPFTGDILPPNFKEIEMILNKYGLELSYSKKLKNY